jgi:hypothetical protein
VCEPPQHHSMRHDQHDDEQPEGTLHVRPMRRRLAVSASWSRTLEAPPMRLRAQP